VARLAPGDARLADWAELLYGQAVLAEGGQLEDPAAFVKRTNELMLAPRAH
jgi:molecular chaperone HtpG